MKVGFSMIMWFHGSNIKTKNQISKFNNQKDCNLYQKTNLQEIYHLNV